MARQKDVSFSSYAFVGNEAAMFGISSFGKFCDLRMAAAVKARNREPMTRFAEAHSANETVESVFFVHYIGIYDEQTILILELVWFRV
jgi:uncharacterized protein (DUF1810 family)